MDQHKIWEKFQNDFPEAFDVAKPRLDFLVRQISRKKLHSKPAVLNIGAGNGYLEETIHQLGWHAYSLDPDQGTVERLKQRDVEAHSGSITKIPFDKDTFDFVVASEVLEHLGDEDRRAAISEIVRVLKDGGWFLGTVPYDENLKENVAVCPQCGEVFHRWGHQKSFDLQALRSELFPLADRTLKRRTFVDLKTRSTMGKIRGIARLVLAAYGAKIAFPSIYFAAQKINA